MPGRRTVAPPQPGPVEAVGGRDEQVTIHGFGTDKDSRIYRRKGRHVIPLLSPFD